MAAGRAGAEVMPTSPPSTSGCLSTVKTWIPRRDGHDGGDVTRYERNLLLYGEPQRAALTDLSELRKRPTSWSKNRAEALTVSFVTRSNKTSASRYMSPLSLRYAFANRFSWFHLLAAFSE